MRWIVAQGDGKTVADILARANADPESIRGAIREGRVFVGRRRVLAAGEAVRPGETVRVSAAAPFPAAGAVRLLESAPGIAAVDKPAGIPTIPDQAGASHSALALAAKLLGVDPSELHPTSRLDREVSGVVLFARSAEARDRLARARASGRYERRYVAIAAGASLADRGVWDAPIGRASDPRRRAAFGRDPIPAETRYAVCARVASGAALLGIAPVTGRTHQIRVHAAHAGAPLFGDRAYGGETRATLPSGRILELRRVALHAARVSVPGADAASAPFEASAPVPGELTELWSALGGDSEAWERATTCAIG